MVEGSGAPLAPAGSARPTSTRPSRRILFSPGQTRATGCRMATGRSQPKRRRRPKGCSRAPACSGWFLAACESARAPGLVVSGHGVPWDAARACRRSSPKGQPPTGRSCHAAPKPAQAKPGTKEVLQEVAPDGVRLYAPTSDELRGSPVHTLLVGGFGLVRPLLPYRESKDIGEKIP